MVSDQLLTLGNDSVSGAIAAVILMPVLLRFNDNLCKKISDLTVDFRVHVGLVSKEKLDKKEDHK